MNRFIAYPILIVMIILFNACGGGGSNNNISTDDTNSSHQDNNSSIPSSAANLNQVVLGPLSGAEINVYYLSDLENPIETVIANNSLTDLALAGIFTLELKDINDSEWLLLTATGGKLLDPDGNGLIDTESIDNHGTIHMLAQADSLKKAQMYNVLTDMSYRLFENSMTFSKLTNTQIVETLNSYAAQLLSDNNASYDDILAFKNINALTIEYDTLNEIYTRELLLGLSNELLLNRLSYILSLQDINDNSENVKVSINKNESYVLEKEMMSSKVVMEQMINSVFVKTEIVTNENQNIVKASYSYNAHTMTLEYKLQQSIDESSIEDIVTLLKMSVKILDGKLEIGIPKELMNSFSSTLMNVIIDGNYYTKDVVEIIDDDPVIGWYFNESTGDVPIKYVIPNVDNYLFLGSESINHSSNSLQFRWNDNSYSCNSNEILIATKKIENEGTVLHYDTLCLSHPTINLVKVAASSLDATTLFSTKGDYLYPLQNKSGAVPFNIKTVLPQYKIQVKLSKNKPTSTSLDGWSSGLSFNSRNKASKIGDVNAYDNKLWVSVGLKNCKDDGYGCPNCDSDEELKYNSDGSGYCSLDLSVVLGKWGGIYDNGWNTASITYKCYYKNVQVTINKGKLIDELDVTYIFTDPIIFKNQSCEETLTGSQKWSWNLATDKRIEFTVISSDPNFKLSRCLYAKTSAYEPYITEKIDCVLDIPEQKILMQYFSVIK